MSVCEICWETASLIAQLLGTSVVDEYPKQVAAHPDGHPTDTERTIS